MVVQDIRKLQLIFSEWWKEMKLPMAGLIFQIKRSGQTIPEQKVINPLIMIWIAQVNNKDKNDVWVQNTAYNSEVPE